IANSVFFALGPIFGDTSGMSLGQIAAFMSLVVLGGVALQWPIGHLSDRFDRRGIILAVSVTAAALAGCAIVSKDQWLSLFYLSAFLYGGFTFSIYPLCVAHSNDHARPDDFIKTASGLLLVYGIGATIGPPLAGLAMTRFGVDAFFQVLMAAYVGMSLFILYRIAVRPRVPGERHEPFMMLNRTSQSALGMLAASDDGSTRRSDRRPAAETAGGESA
ncbi:MAG TPA: MFS transporter, partial [Gammaproteobacteria bacterium]|nr:MFS transporter [Gammaproteobacteria bacterium]